MRTTRRTIKSLTPANPEPQRDRTALNVALSLIPVILAPFTVAMQSSFMTRQYAPARAAAVAPASIVAEAPAPVDRPLLQATSAPDLVLASITGGLDSPDGIAVDPVRGTVYVTEENAGRIVSLQGEEKAVFVDRHTPIYPHQAGRAPTAPPLQAAEGLAIAPDGTLFAAEDVPGGRLLQFAQDAEGHGAWGREVALPFGEHAFAWESVSVGPRGELLLAGSTAEHVAQQGEAAPFESVLLYRDEEGAWWEAQRRLMASFSCAAFSADGESAVFGCEVTGEIGWIDLSKRDQRAGVSAHRFRSPEGLCVLPDGTVLVAEESGRVMHLDPAFDQISVAQAGLGSIESLGWNAAEAELLVTGDEHGEVLRFRAELPAASRPAPFRGRYEVSETAAYPYIPAECPIYLTEVLRMAGFEPESGEDFAKLANRLHMLAVDARATLLNEEGDADPIEHVQFVIFCPGMLGFDLSGVAAPVSGFAVRHRSGKVVKTTLESRESLHVDLSTGLMQALGSARVTVPFAGPAALVNGSAFATFMGLGRMPDFCFSVNPYESGETHMTVLQAGNTVQHYRLDRIPSEANRDWVVAMSPKTEAPWAQLSAPQKLAAMVRPQGPAAALQVASLSGTTSVR